MICGQVRWKCRSSNFAMIVHNLIAACVSTSLGRSGVLFLTSAVEQIMFGPHFLPLSCPRVGFFEPLGRLLANPFALSIAALSSTGYSSYIFSVSDEWPLFKSGLASATPSGLVSIFGFTISSPSIVSPLFRIRSTFLISGKC